MKERNSQSNRSSSSAPTWRLRGVIYRYQNSERDAVDSVSLDVRGGATTAILGPNGSGKSTLLRLILGLRRPSGGSVEFGGRPIESWPRRDLALEVGVVPQDEEINFPLTVRDIVAMGRYPHLGAMRPEGRADREAIESAMHRCDVASLSSRLIQELSGGERQRVRLARALAQEPRVLALDEPTRALDMRHEMEILELLRDYVAEGGTAVVVTHNINLAARYADELVLMSEGRLVASGGPSDILTRERIEHVYRWDVAVTAHPGPGPDEGAVQVTPLSRQQPARGQPPP
jgi:iron complex transport system ATP-binding protein